jgi:2-polyprenyl-3-methyl-5-hydroxy-6-metoxy-1,4-benzoquinol methylase
MAGRDTGFGPLHIVSCEACGHLYNAAFDPRAVEDLYRAFVLTNVPVGGSMAEAIESTAEFILARARPNPAVLEIGGGGGALALRLSSQAHEMHLVEPSRALTADRFTGTNVTFHQAMFPLRALESRVFDVIVCRQVLEHVPEPEPFLRALRSQLNDEGFAYIEMPSAEYICDNASVVDFHYPHVHYYRRPHLETLFARAKFDVVDVVAIKNGHDVGFVLAPTRAKPIAPAPRAGGAQLSARLAERRHAGRKRLKAMNGTVALYGANAYSQALLGLYPDLPVAAMFDDTPTYEGQFAYGPQTDIRISVPSADALRSVDTVVITAYLHDQAISQKLRAQGYAGPIFTVRSEPELGAAEINAGLFTCQA